MFTCSVYGPRWRWTWSRPHAIPSGEGATNGGGGNAAAGVQGGAAGGGAAAGATLERAGSSREGGGAGEPGLATTPTNFPGMHAVRRSGDGSNGGGNVDGRPDLAQARAVLT
jgi:hypothetical protein